MIRRVLIPLIAIIIAGAAAFYARALIEGRNGEAVNVAATPAVVSTLSVLVASIDLPTGVFVKPDMMRWQEWPEVDLPETYLIKGAQSEDELLSGVVRETIRAGEPISRSHVVMPGDRGFLAAVLDPGTRAISVPVNEASSHAGLIFPGDRVDLILTQAVQNEQEESTQQRRASETILSDIRVIAMGRALNIDPETLDDRGSAQIRTATLEVSPRDAEVVALVSEMGKLSLSLRSLALDSEAAANGVDQRSKTARNLPLPSGQMIGEGAVNPETLTSKPVTWDSDISAVIGEQQDRTLNLKIYRPNGVEEVGTGSEGEDQ